MSRHSHDEFIRNGGRIYNIHFSPPLATSIDRAAAEEARTYKEIFRRAIEAYLHKNHPDLQTGREGHNA